MGCNCNKGKRPMAGSKPATATTNTTTARPRRAGFTLVTPDSRKIQYGSELEAMANQRRFGGEIVTI